MTASRASMMALQFGAIQADEVVLATVASTDNFVSLSHRTGKRNSSNSSSSQSTECPCLVSTVSTL